MITRLSPLVILLLLMVAPSAAISDQARLVVPNPSFDRQATNNLATLELSPSAVRSAGHFEILYDPERLDPVGVSLGAAVDPSFGIAWSAIGDGVARIVVSEPAATGANLPTETSDLVTIDFAVVEAERYLETTLALRGGVTVTLISDDSTTTIAGGEPIEVDLLDSQLTDNPPESSARMALFQSRPNPFNPRTEIRFETPSAGRTRLRVYDIAGRLVRTLVDEDLRAGPHTRIWNGTDNRGHRVSSGVYLYRLEFGNRSATKKLTLLK